MKTIRENLHTATTGRVCCLLALLLGALAAPRQLIDRTLAPNAANEGIAKSLAQQIGVGRGDLFTLDSSLCMISRDPFRAIRRGRQLFQRKFTREQGQGPLVQPCERRLGVWSRGPCDDQPRTVAPHRQQAGVRVDDLLADPAPLELLDELLEAEAHRLRTAGDDPGRDERVDPVGERVLQACNELCDAHSIATDVATCDPPPRTGSPTAFC